MKKTTLALGSLAVILGVVAVSTGSVLAYKGDQTVKGPNYSIERHTAMTQAFENKDYTAWKNLMQNKGRVTEVITKDNFVKFVEAQKLFLQGKTTEAQKIREELGLGLKNGSGKNNSGMGRCNGANR